jgi:uncharacterized protein with NRDE domain
MCVLAFAWKTHHELPLVLAGNRDEFHARPTAPADWWDEHPDLVAGRDLQAGGTWMGATRTGRFAVVTNFREPGGDAGERSRGDLVRDFLASSLSPDDWRRSIRASDYGGFNLIFGDGDELHVLSNRVPGTTPLPPGVYGLSNHGLDTPWPKLVRAREGMSEWIASDRSDTERLFEILGDRRPADDEVLPDTGVPYQWEKLLSSVFITSPAYGTRSSTVICFRAEGRALLEERAFDPEGRPAGTRRFEFRTDGRSSRPDPGEGRDEG